MAEEVDPSPNSVDSSGTVSFSLGEILIWVTGLEIFVVRPSDFREEGPMYRSMCLGILWMPCATSLLGLHVLVGLDMFRFFVGGQAASAPRAIVGAWTMATFWGCIATSVLLFKSRRPKGEQWPQFSDYVIRWIAWPGVFTYIGLFVLVATASRLVLKGAQ